MGNHAVGKAMGLAAEVALKARRTGESALDLLDRVCEKYRGYDAEFEAEDPNKPGHVHPEFDDYTDPHPAAALGLLMVEAFAPGGLADLRKYAPLLDGQGEEEEQACDAWMDEVYLPFQKRYGFC